MTYSSTLRTAAAASLALSLGAIVATPAFGAATIVLVNMDGANEGFNDPTPVAPVGGNTGTTLGEQRRIAFQFAADKWGAALNSAVPIHVQAAFNPLTCTPTSATAAAAGAIQIFANAPGREFDNTWYHVALANKLAGVDLAAGATGTTADDIVVVLNSNLNANPACLARRSFYYGLDANHGTNVDMVTVLLHELSHGLGFANFVNEATGSQILNLPDVFSTYTFDVTAGRSWSQMTTNAERQASAINTNRVVWNGVHVNAAAPSLLAAGVPALRMDAPSTLGVFRVGTAAFGPALSIDGVNGDIVQALDPANAEGPTTFDGCSPMTNAVAGRIAVIDRGTCGFIIKVKNAQDAGAIGVIIVDSVVDSPPPGLGGVDPTITIPSVRISLKDGNALKAALTSTIVSGTLKLDMTLRAGTEPSTGKVLLNAPDPVQLASSISHWDPAASPNLLMEPSVSADLPHALDITAQQMTDIGWLSDGDGVPDGADVCLGSDRSATVKIGGIDSGVGNTVFANGCRISDYIAACAANAGNNGGFVACVSDITNQLEEQKVITGAQKGAILSAAAKANKP